MQISPELADYGEDAHIGPPSRLGQRYSATKFLPEAGNTVVCALDFDDPAHQLILEARARLQALPQADRFLFTPVSSLHMTLFDGVIETGRTADAWPNGLDVDLPIEEVTRALTPRLQTFEPLAPFEVGIEALQPTGLLLCSITQADETQMRGWRDALTVPFGMRRPTHDSYRFHMTFAYPIQWLSADVLPVWQAAFNDIVHGLQSELPNVPLKPPAFCQFSDMTAFPPRVSFQA